VNQQMYERILANIKLTDTTEAQAARILIEAGESLARGNPTPLEQIQKVIHKASDATAAKVFCLIITGAVSEVSRTSKEEGRLEGFECGWKRGFDKGFLDALKIQLFRGDRT
jgi:hypothetical protein